MSQPRILMCPPDFYGIEYEINPWMSRSRNSDNELARQQWRTLHDTLVGLGVRVELMTPHQGVPDLVFTANAGLVFKERVFLSSFRHEVRAREEPYFEAWFKEHGFQVERLPEGMYFEGAGDALFGGAVLFAGYRIRSDVHGHQHLAKQLNRLVLPLELVDERFYHLDTCFCPLAPGQAIYFPPAFDEYGRKVLQANISKLIEVEEAEAVRFACNAVVVGKTVVLNTGCERLERSLQEWGYQTRPTPLDEFIKAGGSAKCLTLRLDGEEAARWN
ncbi:MAG: dimethylarginine dimethylaminohydrolase family protein [Gemmataceae bacterium]